MGFSYNNNHFGAEGGLSASSPFAPTQTGSTLPSYTFDAPVDVFVRQGGKPGVEVQPKGLMTDSSSRHNGINGASEGTTPPIQYNQYNTYYGPPPPKPHHSRTERFLEKAADKPSFPPEVMNALQALGPDPFDIPSGRQDNPTKSVLNEAWQASGLGLPSQGEFSTNPLASLGPRASSFPVINQDPRGFIGVPAIMPYYMADTSKTSSTPNSLMSSGHGMPEGLTTYDPYTGKPNVPFDPVTGEATGFWPFDPRTGKPVNGPDSNDSQADSSIPLGASGFPGDRNGIGADSSNFPTMGDPMNPNNPGLMVNQNGMPTPGSPTDPMANGLGNAANGQPGSTDPMNPANPAAGDLGLDRNGVPDPNEIAKPRTKAQSAQHGAIMSDIRIKDLNDRLNSYDTKMRSDAALDLFKILEQNPSISTDPVYQPYIDAFAQKIIQDPSPLVAEPLLLAMQLGYFKNPSPQVMGRLQNLVGENRLMGIEAPIIDTILSNVPMPVSPATNASGMVIPRDDQTGSLGAGEFLPDGTVPHPAEMTAALLGPNPGGMAAAPLPQNPYLGDMSGAPMPGNMLDLSTLSNDMGLPPPQRKGFFRNLFGPKQSSDPVMPPNIQELLNV